MSTSSLGESGSSGFADFAGLGDSWDQLKLVRRRLRDHSSLVLEKPAPGKQEQATEGSISKTAGNLRYNAEIMKPLLVKMSQHRDRVPCVDSLMTEIDGLFTSHGIQPCSKRLGEEAWSVRYLYGLVKQMTYKPAPPKDWFFQSGFYLIVQHSLGKLFVEQDALTFQHFS